MSFSLSLSMVRLLSRLLWGGGGEAEGRESSGEGERLRAMVVMVKDSTN